MNNRLLWADSLKGVLILLVILGHAIQRVLVDECFSNHIWNIIYSFHMPAFMAISGYLSYGKEKVWDLERFGQFIFRRFQQLIIPFLIWSTIFVLVNKDIVFKEFVNIIMYPDSGMWFLWVLFFINVIFVLCLYVADFLKKKRTVLVLCVCVLLITIMVIWKPRMFGFQFISYYFLFFSLGYFINNYQLHIKGYWSVLLTIVWAILAWNWKMQELPSFLKGISLPNTLMQYAYRFITALIAIVILFDLSQRFLNNANRVNRIIGSVGIFSLGIYTVHYVLLWKCVDIFSIWIKNEVLLVTISFITLTILSVSLVKIINRSRLLSKFLLGKV